MIEAFAKRLACYVHANAPESDPEVLQYGYELILQEVFSIGFALILWSLLGYFLPALCTILVFSIIRRLAGGAHARTRVSCFISYQLSLALILALSMLPVPGVVFAALFILSFLLLSLYAPADTEEMPITRHRKAKKLGSLAAFAIFYLLSYLLRPTLPLYAGILAFASALPSLLTHPFIYYLYKCKRFTKKGRVS